MVIYKITFDKKNNVTCAYATAIDDANLLSKWKKGKEEKEGLYIIASGRNIRGKVFKKKVKYVVCDPFLPLTQRVHGGLILEVVCDIKGKAQHIMASGYYTTARYPLASCSVDELRNAIWAVDNEYKAAGGIQYKGMLPLHTKLVLDKGRKKEDVFSKVHPLLIRITQ